MIKTVLISGKMGSGKTTLFAHLKEIYLEKRWVVRELRFAKLIYDMHDFCLNRLSESGIVRPDKDGLLLQLLGTDWGRKTYGENVWVNALRHEYSVFHDDITYQESNALIIISDCRFKNEFQAFPEALRVRLFCSEDVRKRRADGWRENTRHQSEIDLDAYAEAGLFDLIVDTQSTSINGMVDLVKAQLDKGVWIEKRKA